ncbi:MAG: hypothetical protein RM347_013090 [Nostoc sp. ChiQUE02]|uniref:hypothetical protein n=1 Tax=Nostoc sp. ChiQUE02 TaxID=3075377 RepID=UPI002AD25E03|nr:hypothetical protein [Nostoc sp. ChiQUE02]MDZ8233413.1 hypothetical protein [Nostoc sp. ChiQUE02]
MGFAAIAVGISIDAACVRQAMPMAGYAYAFEICSSKSQKITSISNDLQPKPKWYNCQQSWVKQLSGEAKRVGVSLKGEQKRQR